MKSEEPELIPSTPLRWLVRTSISSGSENSKGLMVRTETAELVYGQREQVTGKNDVTMTIITGQCHHKLHGPTSEKSIREMAEILNARGYVPEAPKNHPIQAIEQPLLTGEMLQSSISYGPKYKAKRR